VSEARPPALPFPQPPAKLTELLDRLRLASENPNLTTDDLREVAALPRPWDPPTCPDDIQRLIWDWLDEVVAWINEEHTWRTDRMIPSCWLRHPHLAHELASIACLRLVTSSAVTPEPLEDWHRFALPAFLDRVVQRTGVDGCPPGRHQRWPGEGRQAMHPK
jgi:hypothetical protein